MRRLGSALVAVPACCAWLEPPSRGASAFPTVQYWVATRGTQWERTCGTNQAVNSGDLHAAAKWISRSTKDFAAASTSASGSQNTKNGIGDLEKLKLNGSIQRAGVLSEALQLAREEIAKITDFNEAKRQKIRGLFVRHGKLFILIYIVAYLGMFALFFVGTKAALFTRRTAFECVQAIAQDVDRESFFARVEGWGVYANVGFAFCLNEVAEVFRLPVVIVAYFILKRFMHRTPHHSIFRFNAPQS